MSTTDVRVRSHDARVALALGDIEKQMRIAMTKAEFHERELARWRNRSQILILRRFRLEREPMGMAHA
jgi:hypothetical protein